jgi:hypothetical protein
MQGQPKRKISKRSSKAKAARTAKFGSLSKIQQSFYRLASSRVGKGVFGR